MSVILEELVVVVYIVDAWIDFLKITKTELFFFKVQYNGKIILANVVLICLAYLPHQFSKISIWR